MGLDYDIEVLPFPPRVYKKSFKEINPLGTVPFFVDGDTEMTESSAICHYLVEKYGDGLFSIDKSHREYGDYLNWLYYSDATITFPQAIILRYSTLETEERRQPQVVDDYYAFLSGRLRKLESALEGKDYLCDNRFTIADICVAYALLFAKRNLKLEDLFTPNITKYYNNLQQREAFQKASQGAL